MLGNVLRPCKFDIDALTGADETDSDALAAELEK